MSSVTVFSGIRGMHRIGRMSKLLGFLVQIPFMSPSFFQGPIANWVGVDIA